MPTPTFSLPLLPSIWKSIQWSQIRQGIPSLLNKITVKKTFLIENIFKYFFIFYIKWLKASKIIKTIQKLIKKHQHATRKHSLINTHKRHFWFYSFFKHVPFKFYIES
jgi:hypothetical protein